MIGVPRRIFLQIGDQTSQKDNIDFKELKGITWSCDRINKTDIEYVLKTKKKKKNMKKHIVILLLPLLLIGCISQRKNTKPNRGVRIDYSSKKIFIKKTHVFKIDYTLWKSNPFPHF